MNSPIHIEKTKLPPIEILQEGKAFLGEQYWLFLGISLVAVLIGQAVPMGIVMGAMFVGVNLCCIERYQGRPMKFEGLFKGFESFGDSLIAMLCMVGVTFLVMIPVMIVMMVVLIGGTAAAGEDGGGIVLLVLMPLLYFAMFLSAAIAASPFIFAFPLIADRKMKGMDAVKTSFQAFKMNMMSVIGFTVAIMFIGIAATMMCYIPGILFMPLQFAAYFIAYKRVFPDTMAGKQAPPKPVMA